MGRYKTYHKNRTLRLKNFDYSQIRPYFVTICTKDEKPLLRDKRARSVVACLLDLQARHGFKLYAYCVMPDHVHLLVSPGDSELTLSRIIQTFKSITARRYLKEGCTDKLWQTYFYDHIVRKEEDLRDIAQYIFENPVRKGLVGNWQAYPFSGIVDKI